MYECVTTLATQVLGLEAGQCWVVCPRCRKCMWKLQECRTKALKDMNSKRQAPSAPLLPARCGAACAGRPMDGPGIAAFQEQQAAPEEDDPAGGTEAEGEEEEEDEEADDDAGADGDGNAPQGVDSIDVDIQGYGLMVIRLPTQSRKRGRVVTKAFTKSAAIREGPQAATRLHHACDALTR